MLAKLGIVEEEADETLYWLELLIEAGLISGERALPLQRETHQLLAMIVGSRKTLRARLANSAKVRLAPQNRNNSPDPQISGDGVIAPRAEIENRKSEIRSGF